MILWDFMGFYVIFLLFFGTGDCDSSCQGTSEFRSLTFAKGMDH